LDDATQEDYIMCTLRHLSIEVFVVGSHVKYTPEKLTLREGGSVLARRWLNLSVSMALAGFFRNYEY